MKAVDDVLRGDRYATEPVVKRSTGLWAQIDENRAILEFLKLQAPELLKAHPELEDSFAHRDAWLHDLAEAAEVQNPWCLSRPRGWPRPWPDAEDAPTEARTRDFIGA
jgi:hypothetical protein